MGMEGKVNDRRRKERFKIGRWKERFVKIEDGKGKVKKIIKWKERVFKVKDGR